MSVEQMKPHHAAFEGHVRRTGGAVILLFWSAQRASGALSPHWYWEIRVPWGAKIRFCRLVYSVRRPPAPVRAAEAAVAEIRKMDAAA